MVKSMLTFHLLEKTLLSPQAPAELKGGYRAHGGPPIRGACWVGPRRLGDRSGDGKKC